MSSNDQPKRAIYTLYLSIFHLDRILSKRLRFAVDFWIVEIYNRDFDFFLRGMEWVHCLFLFPLVLGKM